MILPIFIVGNSKLPAKFNFVALTIAYWIFVPGTTIEARVLKHEYRHVQQFTAGWFLGILLVLMLPISGWWFIVSPLTFPFIYSVASLIAKLQGKHPYRQNIFERDARRVAGEPMEY